VLVRDATNADLGFKPMETLKAVGFKLGRWVDSVLMQRELGEGCATAPERGDREAVD
jgi:phosphinothricin acetyltransferase